MHAIVLFSPDSFEIIFLAGKFTCTEIIILNTNTTRFVTETICVNTKHDTCDSSETLSRRFELHRDHSASVELNTENRGLKERSRA